MELDAIACVIGVPASLGGRGGFRRVLGVIYRQPDTAYIALNVENWAQYVSKAACWWRRSALICLARRRKIIIQAQKGTSTRQNRSTLGESIFLAPLCLFVTLFD